MLKKGICKIAPIFKFHPDDQFGPCSIDWLINRCDLTQGRGDLTWVMVPKPIYLPSSMTTVKAGPLTQADLTAATQSSNYGDGYKNEDIGLWPMVAAPGQQPNYTVKSTDAFYFSDHQLETLYGEIPPTSTPTTKTGAACYVHVSSVVEPGGVPGASWTQYFLVNFYFLCAYNGAMAGSSWDAPPLEGTNKGGGMEQHFGDIMRVGFRLQYDPPSNMFVCLATEFDAHGETTIRDDDGVWAWGPRSLEELTQPTVYSAWHSHELYWKAGKFPTPKVFFVHDYTADGGLSWDTKDNLVFCSAGNPTWINYNGRIGNNVHQEAISHAMAILTTGPVGPAFKSDWVRGTETVLT